MTVTVIAPVAASRNGISLSIGATDVVAGDEYAFPNYGNTRLFVDNQTGLTCSVTIVTPSTRDGLAVADRVIPVPDGDRVTIGPFPVADYNDSDGRVHVMFSQAVSIKAVYG